MDEDEKHKNLGRPPNSREGWKAMRQRGQAGYDDDRLPKGVFTEGLTEENKKDFLGTTGIGPADFDTLYNQLYERGLAGRHIALTATEALVMGRWVTRTSMRVSELITRVSMLEAALAMHHGGGMPPTPSSLPPTMVH